MENQIKPMLQNAASQIQEGSDFLVLVHRDGKYGAIAKGNTDLIAQAFFALLHDPKSEIAMTLYRIMKLNVMNTLNNPSPYAANLSDAIHNIIDKDDE